MKPLVSIITPCYNGESYITCFLDSILYQTYPNIELWIVNDGSKDKTEEIILSYKSKFDDKGYKLNYIYQENAGQSAAINKVLPLFHGDYMTWPDSDDYLPEDAIEKKVAYMEANPDKGLCICKTKVVEFSTGKVIGEQKRIPPVGEDNLFEDLIMGQNVYYSPGGYMVRSSMFYDAMPSMQIQAPREIGQNYQLLLPIAYKYPCGYIDEYLYYYSMRLDSHSHIEWQFEDRMNIIENISYSVLNNIAESIEHDNEKLSRIKRTINIHKLKSQLSILLKYRRNDYLKDIILQLKNMDAYDEASHRMYLYIKYPVLRFVPELRNRLFGYLSTKRQLFNSVVMSSFLIVFTWQVW